VVVRPEKGGSALLAKFAKSPLRDRVFCISLRGHKDVSDLHCHGAASFMKAREAAKEATISRTDMQKTQGNAQAEEDEKLSSALARSGDISAQVATTTVQTGFVGEASGQIVRSVAFPPKG
jgi:predicted Rossmann fold nucleotide-binding protein DprA/Smf involved in DNA uptake